MSAVSSPPLLDLGSLLLALSLPTSPRRSPKHIVMDRLNVRLYETHEEVTLARDAPLAEAASIFVFPDRVAASPVTLRVRNDEGRSGGTHDLPTIRIDHSDVQLDDSDDVIRAVFAVSANAKVCEDKCSCRACQISSGALTASATMEDKPRRPLTIADMDVREMDEDGRPDTLLTPADHSQPTTPNANRSRRASEKLDYGINWMDAFQMAPPRQRNSTLADEVDGRLSAMNQEEHERELMAETLQKVDQVSKRKSSDSKRSTLLFDSNITLKDIFGQSAKSDDVVFNTSISLDDIFAGIKTASSHPPPAKKPTTDKYYYHDDDEDEEEVLPPEVADLYAARPSSTHASTLAPSSRSHLPHTSSVNMDDVFAALEKRQEQARAASNLDDYYADPPSEIFSDSALSSSRQHTESKATGREEEEEGGSETRSSSSGCSPGKVTPPHEDASWISSIVSTIGEKKRPSVELRLAQQASTELHSTDEEPSPPLDPAQLYLAETPKQTRKESYLQVGELFSHHVSKSPDRPAQIEEEPATTDSGTVVYEARKSSGNIDWISRLAGTNAEEILDAVFTCSAVGGNGGKKCGCQACDPTRSIYLEREAAAETEERKRSLHVVNPVEITLEEVFDGPKAPAERQPVASSDRRTAEEARTVEPLAPVNIDLEVVFATPIHSPTSKGLVDSDRWQSRTIVKEVHQSVAPQERKRSPGHQPPLAVSEISLSEVFNGSARARSSTTTPTNTPTTELDVSAIFTSSSPTSSTSRVNIDKFTPKTLERRQEAPTVPTEHASRRSIMTDPVDMDAVFNPTKDTLVSTSTYPVLITNEDETKKESAPVIIAEELVAEAIDEALRSPKMENSDDHGMISNSSFPVFLMEKKTEPSSANNQDVKFGLNSSSASPEPINLDQVFSGVSNDTKPRVDLSKFEQRTLERRREAAPQPMLVTTSTFPVIIADPVDMDQVFNPSTSHAQENVPSILITNSSVPVIIAEEVVSGAINEALRSPKLEKAEEEYLISSSSFPVFVVDRKHESHNIEPRDVQFGLNSRSASPEPLNLDQVFNGVSSEAKPRIDLSKFEARTLERQKQPVANPVMVTTSTFPVIIADPLDMDQVFNPSTSKAKKEEEHSGMITNSSVPVIIAEEIVSEAVEDALRSPKFERTEDHVMITNSSFPIFLVDKMTETPTLKTQDVKFGLSSRSASPEPVDLDQVYTGASSETNPRVDLSKFEKRRLEQTQPTANPTMITTSTFPVIIADPVDMDQVFNPSTIHDDEDNSSTLITNSSVPVIIAEKVASSAMDEALRSPKLEKTEEHGLISNSTFPVFLIDQSQHGLEKSEIDLDSVFAGASSSSQPHVDLSKFEVRTLERQKQPVRQVRFSNSSVPVIIADPLDMDLVFRPSSSIAPSEDKSAEEAPPVLVDCVFTDRPSSKPYRLDSVTDSMAEVIVADAIDAAIRSPELVETASTSSFSFNKEERMDSFAVIDSATSLDQVLEHASYPKRITHVRSSAPVFETVEERIEASYALDALHEVPSSAEEEDDQETPLPVFARSRNPHYDNSTVDRPYVSRSEDAPQHISDPITIVTDLTPTSSIKKIISPEPSAERIGPNVSTIDLEEVFASRSASTSESRVDLDKFQPRTLERQKAPAKVEEVKRESTTPSLPASTISIDDIFNPQPKHPVAEITAPAKPPRMHQSSDSSDPMDDPAAEVDLDSSVFDTSFGSDTNKYTPRPSFYSSTEPPSASSLLPSKDVVVEVSDPPVPPPRRVSPPRSETIEVDSEVASAIAPPRKKLVSQSSFPILLVESSEDTPTPPPRRAKSPQPRVTYPGVILVEEIQYPATTETPPPSLSTTPVPPTRHRRTDSISLPRSRTTSHNRISESIAETEEPALTVDATWSSEPAPGVARPSVTVVEHGSEATVDIVLPPRPPPKLSFPPPPPVEEIDYEVGYAVGKITSMRQSHESEDESTTKALSTVEEEEIKEARLMASPDFPPISVVTAPVEIDMNEVFDSRILTPNRYDSDRWQPRTLEREKKKAVEEIVEKREKSDLPESKVDIDEIFSGRLTTTSVEYAATPARLTLKKTEEKEEKNEKWEDDLSKEIDDYERRRNRLGQETDGSMRSTLSRASSVPFSSTPEGTWRRNESMRSMQEPVVALIEKEKFRKISSASSMSGKSGKVSKRPGSGGNWKVEHKLEPQSDGLIEIPQGSQSSSSSGARVEAREAKKNGKMWRVDRVQKAASASIEDIDDDRGGVRIQVHTIPQLSVLLDSLDDIERSIDEVFDDALSPRGRSIEITRVPSSSLVHVDVHRHDEQPSEPYPHPEYTTETIKGGLQYRSVTSLPSTSETTKIVFPLHSASSPPPIDDHQQRYVTSASIRLEKTLPTPETTMERPTRNGRLIDEQIHLETSHLHWQPTSIPTVIMRKRSRSEGPLGLLEDVVVDGPDSDDIRNYRMSWHPSSIRSELEDRGYKGSEEKIHGSLTTTVRVAGYSSPKSSRSREARERRKKIIRKSRHSVSSSTTSIGDSTSTRPDEEEMLEVEVTKRHIVLRGSYNLVVSKDEPLGLLLLSLSDGQPIVPAALDFSVLPKLRRLLREAMTRRARSVSILSSRGASLLEMSCPATDNLKSAISDLFHPIDNPRGKVNLCTAENRVCEPEVSKKLEEIRYHQDTHRWMQRYAGNGGLRDTKLSLISHFNNLHNVSIDEDEAALLPSCTAAYDLLSHLSCDPQDVILTPAPYYARIRNDCAERNECRVETVQLDMSRPELFVSDFEREYSIWASKGERVRAIILVNPHNPLGNIFTRHHMLSVCEWAISNDIFIIVDEILAGTIYTENDLREFPSMLELKKELSKPEMLVWMGSLSKDLGIPGIRTALVVVSSPTLREAVIRLENLSAVPAPSQLIINQLIADRVWLSFTLLSSRRRLHSHARFVVDSLSDIGVPTVAPKGGICLMADFSQFMPAATSEEENALHRRFIDHGVVLTKGESTATAEPGWFRISFGLPKEELELGIRRVYCTIARESTLKRTINYEQKMNGVKKEWLVADVRATSPGTTVESA